MSVADITAMLIELERQRGQALVARDATALEALWPPDLMHIHSTGAVMNRVELLAYVLGTLQFLRLERSELQVRVFGDVALMTGRMRTRMQRIDKPEPVDAESWVTQLWVRTNSGWVQSHFHAVRASA